MDIFVLDLLILCLQEKLSGTSNGKAMILSNCATGGRKKSRFVKNQEAKGLLGDILF